MSTVTSPIDRFSELGGELFLQGDVIRYRIPCDKPEARQLLAEIRKDREAIKALLQERESSPPTLDEVKAGLPEGTRLVRYEPKQAPFAVAPVSIVTNAGKFYRTYLQDFKRRIEKPEGCCYPSLRDICDKLADAGLELEAVEPEGRHG